MKSHNHPPHEPPCTERAVGRCLVVIDPEDREQVERLMRHFWDGGAKPWEALHGGTQERMVLSLGDALRSLITPSRPEEPTGQGAVVEATAYTEQVRQFVRINGSGTPWYDADGNGHAWRELNPIRVISEGVTS